MHMRGCFMSRWCKNASGAPPFLYNHTFPLATPFVTPPSHSVRLNDSTSEIYGAFFFFAPKKKLIVVK